MSIGDDLADAFQPWLTQDLDDYLHSLGDMFEQVERIVGDMSVNESSYPDILDVDTTQPEALGYLAQYVGERLPVGISEAAAREWISDRPNSRRGTAKSIFLAAQRTLTGTRLVSLRLRTKLDGSPHVDYIAVRTITSQTPDPDSVYHDLRKNIVPADIVLEYDTVVGQTWQDVRELNGVGSITTWQDVKDFYADWRTVYTTLSGDTVFTRPPRV